MDQGGDRQLGKKQDRDRLRRLLDQGRRVPHRRQMVCDPLRVGQAQRLHPCQYAERQCLLPENDRQQHRLRPEIYVSRHFPAGYIGEHVQGQADAVAGLPAHPQRLRPMDGDRRGRDEDGGEDRTLAGHEIHRSGASEMELRHRVG